jgi:hypothetical protein
LIVSAPVKTVADGNEALATPANYKRAGQGVPEIASPVEQQC